MTHVYHEFSGCLGVAEEPVLMRWHVVPFADSLPRFHDEFDLILDRVPSGGCVGSLGGIEMRQEKSH